MDILIHDKSIDFEEILKKLDIRINPNTQLPIFKNNSESYQHEILEKTNTGIFIFDVDVQMIVWGNNKFYEINQIKAEHLFHPALKKLIDRKIHRNDFKYFKNLKTKINNNELIDFISQIIRIRQKNNSYNYYQFHLLTPQEQKNKRSGKVMIGIQYDITNMLHQYLQIENSKATTVDCPHNEDFEKLSSLSKREKQILELIVQGHTDKEIARILNISFYTVETHRKNIIQKLPVKNTACLSFLTGKCGFF
jgi:DNA-binding CsgD family transcriptional regulator